MALAGSFGDALHRNSWSRFEHERGDVAKLAWFVLLAAKCGAELR